MCGFDVQNVSIGNVDSFHSFATSFLHEHYAHIWNYCSLNKIDCKLNTSTATQNWYYGNISDFFADYLDTGGRPNGAIEMRHKMKSKQACYEHINGGYVEEDFNICGKINQYTINWAMQSAPKQTLDRYLQYGEYLQVGDDIKCTTGTDWSWTELKESRTCNEDTHKYYTLLTSFYLFTNTTKNGCEFGQACGAHYCKILSPAHVMEWMYYEGLRFNLSIANMNKTVNITCD